VLPYKGALLQTMRWHAKVGLLLLLFSMAGLPGTGAQEKQAGSNRSYRAVREAPASPAKPLTLDEGLAILNAALDSRHHAGFNSDCSHFVHGLYENAGFPYEYAPSSDLYEGIDEFRRVAKPQPGDLAVWHGHAGIVVNPAQHSFFSLLSSGAGVDSYDSPYWRHRGRPRFFRYARAAPSGGRSASLKTASLNPGAEEAASDDSEESSENVSVSGPAAKRLNAAISSATVVHSPVVHFAHPKTEQVDAAFLQACADSEDSLRVQDLLKGAQPVIVFDHFSVSAMHTAGNQGWVDVQIDEVLFFVDGKAEVRRGLERQRWPLSRHDKTSWELTVPRGTIYVPQDIAVRVLSHQLARLTEERPDSAAKPQQKAELARVLDSLLQK
jgi:hypothetical protein